MTGPLSLLNNEALALYWFDVASPMGGCQSIMVPFGVPIIVRHLLFRVPKKIP